jgi:hypothetical protein
MSSEYEVLLWGLYFCDLIFTDLTEVPKLGAEVWSRSLEMMPGGAYTTAVAMQRLGLRARWMCDFGNDSFSQFILDAARREGLDESLFCIHPQPVRRVSAVFSLLGDRGFLSFVDDVEGSSPLPIIEEHRPRCVLLPHLHYGQSSPELFAAARPAGSTLFMDCQATEATLDTPGVVDALRSVDIFSPNETEALQLTGAATVEEALSRLAELTPLVVIKVGAGGAIARSGEEVVRVPAIQVQAVDTTGAGDCFCAGFLYSYLQGAPLEVCLQSGNICGGLSTTAVGGPTAAPTAAQVEEVRAGLVGL